MLQLWRFFPQFRNFRASLGTSLLFLGIFAFIPSLHFWCCLFCSVCLFSSSLSPPVASLVCFSCWPGSGCSFGVLSGAPSCLSLTFLHLLICFAARMAPKFVSHRSGLVAVYMTKLGYWGGFTHVGVRVRFLMLYPAGGPYICVWGFFCGGGAVYPLLLGVG